VSAPRVRDRLPRPAARTIVRAMALVDRLAAAAALVSIWAGCGQVSQSSPAAGMDGGDAAASSSGMPIGSMGNDSGVGAGDDAPDDAPEGDASDAGCVIGDASVLGMECPSACRFESCCGPDWSQQCLAQGGAMERCVWGGGCEGPSGTCYPPPQPEAGSFGCVSRSCARGQACVLHALQGDGCESHYCDNPPFPCDDAGNCPCPGDAGGSSGGSSRLVGCANDDAGNARIVYLY
jgi:hypothetical protein